MRLARLIPLLILMLIAMQAADGVNAGGAIFTVNVLSDSNDATTADPRCDVDFNAGNGDQCSLRAAIQQANTTPGTDAIVFTVGGGGAQTISPTTPLPEITAPVAINAATQPGCGSYPCIELDGSMVPDLPPTIEPGFIISGGGTTIRGFIINGFLNNYAIEINSGDANTIVGNWIGTNAGGTAADANGAGISILSADNVVGGTTAADRNVVSGNTGMGISIHVPAASANVIQGNYVGLNAAGTAAVPNGSVGIGTDGTNTVIGGTAPGARNVISGNNFLGVTISGDDSTFLGNYVGTNAAGDAAVPNTLDGVFVGNVTGVTIGGTSAGARNVISGNLMNGLRIDGTDLPAVDTVVQGNYIGTNAAGTAPIANGQAGIRESMGTETLIGGTSPAARNIISGNLAGLTSIASTGTTLLGNYVGTNAAGTAPIPNGMGANRAIDIINGTNVVIGGEAAGARNVVSGNLFDGIRVSGSTNVDVTGNWVGISADGDDPLGNARDGIQVGAGNTDLMIQDNVSVANGGAGIGIYFETDVEVLGNRVGVTPDGDAMGNGDGIRLWGTLDVVIGNTAGGGNIIAHNLGDGVDIDGGRDDDRSRVGASGGPVPALRNTVRGNSIHTNGGLGIDNVNGGNTELAPPVLLSVPFMITGTACANCIIDVYSDDDTEGRVHEGSTVADGSGNFTFSEPMTGPFTTATATDGDGNTSEFSAPVVTPDPPTPAPTPEPTATPTPTATPGPTETPGLTATPTPAPTETPAASETPAPEGTQGDTDCDEDADSVDALFVLREVAGFVPSKCIESGDVDCDEDRDSVDALGILRFVAALPPLAQNEPCADIGTQI